MTTIKTCDGREIQVEFVDYYDDLWKSYNEGVRTREQDEDSLAESDKLNAEETS